MKFLQDYSTRPLQFFGSGRGRFLLGLVDATFLLYSKVSPIAFRS